MNKSQAINKQQRFGTLDHPSLRGRTNIFHNIYKKTPHRICDYFRSFKPRMSNQYGKQAK